MRFNKTLSILSIKKQLLFFSCIFILSSCGSNKENTLLKVLQAIEQDTISSVENLCTTKAFEQIQLRKRAFQSLLISDWDLHYQQVKCSDGENLSYCHLCDELESCISLDYLKLINIEGKWLVDHHEYAPTVVVERFLGYLEKMDFEAARKIASPKLGKELIIMESIITLFKDTGTLNKSELKKIRQKITDITSFNPALEWLTCKDDPSYPNTKICFLCNPLFKQTDEMIRVTKMKDQKWYVEYYE